MEIERTESAINEEALVRMLNKTRAFLREEQKKAAGNGAAGFEDEEAAEIVLSYLKRMIPGQPGRGERALFEHVGKELHEEGSESGDASAPDLLSAYTEGKANV
jgi:hypothetical protein